MQPICSRVVKIGCMCAGMMGPTLRVEAVMAAAHCARIKSMTLSDAGKTDAQDKVMLSSLKVLTKSRTTTLRF